MLNRSDNRELYFHLDTMTPLRLEADHEHHQPQHYLEYNYDDDETNNIYPPTTPTTTTTTTTVTTTSTSTTTATTTTILSFSRTFQPIFRSTFKSDNLFEDIQEPSYLNYDDAEENYYSESEDTETVLDLSYDNEDVLIEEEIGDSLEILKNLSLIPDRISSNISDSYELSKNALQCDEGDTLCRTLQVVLFMIVMGILFIILALYFDMTPGKCVRKLRNSDRRVIL